MSKFGELVKWRRKEKGLTLDEVARKIRSHKGYVSGIENGKVPPPSVKIIQRFAKLFECDVRALVRLAWADKAPRMIREDAQRVLALMNAENSSRGDIVNVPLLNTEALPYPTEINAEGLLIPATDVTLVLPRARRAAEYAATVRDDSMSRPEGKSLAAGDVILLARCDKLCEGGVAYIVFTADGRRQAAVRNLKIKGDHLTLEAWNKAHSPIDITQDDVDACYHMTGVIKVFDQAPIDAAV